MDGTPPDLTLTVRLDNVRKEEGQWRLELTNDAGTGRVTFYIHGHSKLSSFVGNVASAGLKRPAAAITSRYSR
nr:hypothetical protein BaRGS_004402 [Batillaria attramentaria]